MANILHDQINLKKVSSDTYSASWHNDWNVGLALHGGHVAAVIHHAVCTHLVTDPKLIELDQPDVLKLHIDFLRSSERCDSTIVIRSLKLGAIATTLNVELSQKGRVKATASAVATNLERSSGPGVPTGWALLPAPDPVPDFDLIHARKPEPNWLSWHAKGQAMPFTHRLTMLVPRRGFATSWLADAWNRFEGDERMDATYLTAMADVIPSMADTLLRNKGFYDAHDVHSKAQAWEEKHPGEPLVISNTFAEIMQSETISATLTMDIEFKRRVPKEGLRWIFTRVATRMMQGGRLDLDITICDEDMELVCVAQQLILALEGRRKFERREPKAAL